MKGWKRSYLSSGGRLVLIRAVLSALPTYFLSLFKIPRKVAREIEKKFRNFLRESEDGGKLSHLVKWVKYKGQLKKVTWQLGT